MNLVEKSKCSGCMACYQACPKHCINVAEDEQGNLWPEIDATSCVHCMKCYKACPELNGERLFFKASKKAYAAWSLNEQCRSKSASGGIASVMYHVALSQGYWICGSEYQEHFHVVHTLTNKSDAIGRFQQSKYVYSETGNVFADIKKLLEKGEGVLFISLPCKVAGLLTFLGKHYEKLIAIDIVCHGTPPYKQLADHIKNIDRSCNAKLLSFRNDNDFAFKLKSDSGILYNKYGMNDEYLSAFLNGLNYRESCYHCRYARPERISDITICDFWGLGKDKPFEHPYTGSISAVLINTAKGEKFFSLCQDLLFIEERTVDEAVDGNTQLRHPSHMHPNRESFLREYPVHGFDKAARICLVDEMKAAKVEQLKKQCKGMLKRAVGVILPQYRN